MRKRKTRKLNLEEKIPKLMELLGMAGERNEERHKKINVRVLGTPLAIYPQENYFLVLVLKNNNKEIDYAKAYGFPEAIDGIPIRYKGVLSIYDKGNKQ